MFGSFSYKQKHENTDLTFHVLYFFEAMWEYQIAAFMARLDAQADEDRVAVL